MYNQSNNLNAEYINEPKMQGQQYQGRLPQGQPLIGYPVVENQQQQQPVNNGQQYFQQPQGQVLQGFQQMIVIPNRTVVVVDYNIVNLKDYNLRKQCRYFYGCNCCFGVLALIFMIIRCIEAFGYDGLIIGAGVLYIVSDFFFIIGAICGQYAISRYKLVFIAMLCEIAGSGIAFAYYRQSQQEENDKYSDEKGKETGQYVNLIVFIVFLIILVFAYGAFIRLAKRIRFLMLDLFQIRQQQQLAQQQH